MELINEWQLLSYQGANTLDIVGTRDTIELKRMQDTIPHHFSMVSRYVFNNLCIVFIWCKVFEGLDLASNEEL